MRHTYTYPLAPLTLALFFALSAFVLLYPASASAQVGLCTCTNQDTPMGWESCTNFYYPAYYVNMTEYDCEWNPVCDPTQPGWMVPEGVQEYSCSWRAYECNDGIDNDSNGQIDYPTDTGCNSASDDDEAGGGGGGGGPTAPAVTTNAATSITSSSATLNGTADPNGALATGFFRYRTTNGTCSNSFGTRLPASSGADLGSGSSGVAYSQSLTGLTAGQIYYFCAGATNSVGTTYGSTLSFTASASAPPAQPDYRFQTSGLSLTPNISTNPLTALINTALQFAGKVQNNGDAAGGNTSKIRFEVDTDADGTTFGTGTVTMDTATYIVPNLAAATSDTTFRNAPSTWSTATYGWYRARLTADTPGARITESSETNNDRTFTFFVSGGMQCSDGVDNDTDTLIDYGSDPGCTSPSDNDETDTVVVYPDLVTSGITPFTATAGVSQTFNSTVTNQGAGSTGIGYTVLYQRADSFAAPPACDTGAGWTTIAGGACRKILTTTGTLTKPSGWNDSNNTIECVGPGGTGSVGTSGRGGGGGAYAKKTNFTLPTSQAYTVGGGGSETDTVFGAACTADAGKNGGTAGAGAGGLASASVGDAGAKFDGGSGDATGGWGGGGGAAGPNDAGKNGGNGGDNGGQGGGGGGGSNGGTPGNAFSGATGGAGGHGTSGAGGGPGGTTSNGSNGTVGGGGGGGGASATSYRGGFGGSDTTWGSAGLGGGGGGGGRNTNGAANGIGGNGGTYGGGGGAASTAVGVGGPGAQGVIVVTYTPAGGGPQGQQDLSPTDGEPILGPSTPEPSSISYMFPSGEAGTTKWLRACADYPTDVVDETDDTETSNCGAWTEITLSAAPSASFTSSPNCTIASGAASCTSTVSWTSSNVTTVALTDCSAGLYTTTGSGAQTYGPPGVTVPYNSGCYQIRNGGVGGAVLATANLTSSCTGGTSWNGSACVVPPPSCSIFTVTSAVTLGQDATVQWSCQNATSCVELSTADGFSTDPGDRTGNPTTATDTVTPTDAGPHAAYGMRCYGPGAPGGQDVYSNTFEVLSPNASITAAPPRVNPGDTTVITATCTGIGAGGTATVYGPSGVIASGTADANGNYTYTSPPQTINTQSLYTIECTPLVGDAVDTSVTVKFLPIFEPF